MPKLILKSGKEIICQRYGADGLDFLGDFAAAKATDKLLQQDDLVRLETEHGGATLLDLEGYEYTGDMIVRRDGTYTACIKERNMVMSEEDYKNIRVARILLGEEES